MKFSLFKIITNTILITLFALMGYLFLFIVFPIIYNITNHQKIMIFLCILSIICFLMFIWCWISTAVSDPGRIVDDLKKRGLLEKVQRGEIPSSMKNLPICYICEVPMPPNSHHCDKCNSCMLSFDHHCGYIGNCIACKNIKSFHLSFYYGSIFGLIWAFFGFFYFLKIGKINHSSKLMDCLVLLTSVYVGMISFSVLLYELLSLCNKHNSFRRARSMRIEKTREMSIECYFVILKQFLINFLMKFVPIHYEAINDY